MEPGQDTGRLELRRGRERGIHLAKAEEIEWFQVATGEVRKEILPDNVDFEIDEFNRAVITKPFNDAGRLNPK